LQQSELALLRRSAIVSYAISISEIACLAGMTLLYFWVRLPVMSAELSWPLTPSMQVKVTDWLQTMDTFFPLTAITCLVAFALSLYFARRCFQLGKSYQLGSLKAVGIAGVLAQASLVAVLVALYFQVLIGVQFAPGSIPANWIIWGYVASVANIFGVFGAMAYLIVFVAGMRGLRNFTEMRTFTVVMVLSILGLLGALAMSMIGNSVLASTITDTQVLGAYVGSILGFTMFWSMPLTITLFGFGLSRLAKQGGAKRAIAGR